jgi:hypothetical protein
MVRVTGRDRQHPLARLLADAPVDDEPWTADEEAALDDVRADREAGHGPLSVEDVKRDLGLT